MTKTFSKKAALAWAWSIYKYRAGLLIAVVATMAVITYAPQLIGSAIRPSAPFWAALVSLAASIAALILDLGFLKITLALAAGQEVNFQMLFSQIRPFFKYAAASLLYGAAVGLGILFLVVPGIILGIAFQFFALLIIDQDLKVFAAFRKSAEITKGARWQLFVFGLILLGINILGTLFFLIGRVVSVPITVLATVWVYRELAKQSGVTPTLPTQSGA